MASQERRHNPDRRDIEEGEVSTLESNEDTSIEIEPISSDSQHTILVVDDEPVNIQVLKNQLGMKNFEVLEAESGMEALEILEGTKPDLMILDLMMPRMGGYEVAEKVRSSYNSSQLPIVMLTAKNQVSDLVEGFQKGINDYLTKPFHKDELYSRIRTHLNLSQTTTAYERFVPHDFLDHLEKDSIIDVALGDHIEGSMSILFSDIRSFTTLSEQLSAKETFNFINAYLSRMEPVITQNKGFVDKYIGDAIMATFPDKPDDAIQAAIQMLSALQEYNAFRSESGESPIEIGLGVNTGDLMLGTIGGKNRMEGTVISDAVNLASRIEGMTKLYGAPILITDSTFHALENPSQFDLRVVDKVAVKGKVEPVTIFEVLNCEPEAEMEAKLKTAKQFEEGISLYYSKEFEEAQGQFTQCMIQTKGFKDPAVQMYIERCMHYIKHGWDEKWDGVTRWDVK